MGGRGGVEREKRTFSLPQSHERLRGEEHEVVRGLQLRRGEVRAEGQRAHVRREVRVCARALRRGRQLRRGQDEAPQLVRVDEPAERGVVGLRKP